MLRPTKPLAVNIVRQLAAMTFVCGLAPHFSRAEEPAQQRAVPSTAPLVNRIEVLPPKRDGNGLAARRATAESPRPTISDGDVKGEGSPRLLTNPQCLAAYYDFTDYDPKTGSVKDKSGNDFHLTVIGKPADAVQGISGKAAQLDGGYFQAKGNPLVGADHFTISVWFKAAEPMNNYKLASAAVWSGGNNASGWNIGTHYSELWADNQEGSLRGGPGWERGVEFRKGEWNHLVVSYDGAHVREYVNGKQSLSIQGTGRRVGIGEPMVVGAWMGSFQFHGVIDEMRIYRRALKKKEVQSLYIAPTNNP